MSQYTQIEFEQKDCIHILGIQNAPWLFSAKSNTPQRRKTHAPDSHRYTPSTEEIRSQQPKGISRQCRDLYISHLNKNIVCSIFYVFRMHLNCFLQSRIPLWGGRHRRLPVTNAHLQQKKYKVKNPKGHLVDVVNHTDRNRTKRLYLPYSMYQNSP